MPGVGFHAVGGEDKFMKSKNGSWIVTLECVVKKEVICENCTREEAESNPFGLACSERELSTRDWSVGSIEAND